MYILHCMCTSCFEVNSNQEICVHIADSNFGRKGWLSLSPSIVYACLFLSCLLSVTSLVGFWPLYADIQSFHQITWLSLAIHCMNRLLQLLAAHVHAYIYVCTCVHTYIRIYIHTCIRVYIDSSNFMHGLPHIMAISVHAVSVTHYTEE